MPIAPGQPGVRAGGGRAFLTNPGVRVTYIQTPSPPAVGVWRRVRIIVSTVIIPYGVAVREMRFGRSKPAHGPIPVLLHCSVVTDIVRVPALAFVYSVTVVDGRLQCTTHHHFNIVFKARPWHAV